MRKAKFVLYFSLVVLLISLIPMTIVANTSTSTNQPFSDVQGHWGERAILNMVDLGVVNGFPDGSFKPDAQVTRAEFIKMVVQALGLETDIMQPGPAWYEVFVHAAVEEGIHRKEDFDGDWNQPLTRMEMVRLAVRAVDEETRAANAVVSDESMMLKATKQGLIHGVGDGKLAPKGRSTRAQAVTVIERILDLRDGKELPVDPKAIETADMDLRTSLVPFLSEDEIWDPERPELIKLEVARYYEMKVHESFYVEDGHLKGYLPELPEGFYYSLAFDVYYDPKDKVTATNFWQLNYGYKLQPGESFSLPILHEDKVKKMILSVGLADSTTHAERRFSNMDFYNNREITEYIKY